MELRHLRYFAAVARPNISGWPRSGCTSPSLRYRSPFANWSARSARSCSRVPPARSA